MNQGKWKEVEARLSHPFGRVMLLADGYRITAIVSTTPLLRTSTPGIAVFIDGVIEWIPCRDGEALPQRKFWRLCKEFGEMSAEFARLANRPELSPELRKIAHGLGKGAVLDPTWPNAKALCRHLRKTCTNVEILQEGAQ